MRTLFPKPAARDNFVLSGAQPFPDEMPAIGRWHWDAAVAPQQLPEALCGIADPKHCISVTIVAATLAAAFLLRVYRHPDGFEVLPSLHLEELLGMGVFYEGHPLEIAAAHMAVPRSPPQAPHPRGSVSDDEIPPPRELGFRDELVHLEVEVAGLTRRGDGGAEGELSGAPGSGGTAGSEGMRTRSQVRRLVGAGSSDDAAVAGVSGYATGVDGRGPDSVELQVSVGLSGALTVDPEQAVPWPEDGAMPMSGVL